MKSLAPLVGLLLALAGAQTPAAGGASTGPGEAELWSQARQHEAAHRFSTLFTAHDVRQSLSSDQGIRDAVAWCKNTGVTKVYVETFRDGYQAERPVLENARAKLRAAGLEVSGCVTTTKVGKPSTGWKEVACCYTDSATQRKLQSIFENTAGLFDEIMIDDFWFTDCACPECDSARLARTVTVGGKKYPVGGDSWADYRCELMARLSQELVLAAAKRVNSKARLIIKYPQWYDNFHNRGYDVARETSDFDRIWVGTETRDYDDPRWGGTVQYEAYFIMRWLGGLGGAKCGGGWYDSLGTTPLTYVEQARQTVLAGARESMLFSYGGLQREGGRKDVEALRANIAELFAVAENLRLRQPLGIAAYKPANSDPAGEARVFDFAGMMGLPLAPCHEFPTNAPAAFFSMHALKDSAFGGKLAAFLAKGRPALVTDGLAQALKDQVNLASGKVQILNVNRDPKSLLKLEASDLESIRRPLLAPFKTTFRAPNRVALYLFADQTWVTENFNDEPAQVELNGKKLQVPARGWLYSWEKPKL